MDSKLYGAAYLEQTAQLLKNIKNDSYAPFLHLREGLLVDVGCGVGQDVINLAQLLPASVQLKGVDANPEMIAKAEENKPEASNLSFAIADASALPFPEATMDGLRNERLIQHLQAPQQAFEEFNRVLKPSAPIVIVETDWSSMNLYNCPPGLGKLIRNYYAEKNVPHGDAAVCLYHWLKDAGFTNVKLKLYPLVSYSLDQVIAFTRLDFVMQKMQEEQVISKEELDTINATLKEADAAQSFALCLNIVVATAEKI